MCVKIAQNQTLITHLGKHKVHIKAREDANYYRHHHITAEEQTGLPAQLNVCGLFATLGDVAELQLA